MAATGTAVTTGRRLYEALMRRDPHAVDELPKTGLDPRVIEQMLNDAESEGNIEFYATQDNLASHREASGSRDERWGFFKLFFKRFGNK